MCRNGVLFPGGDYFLLLSRWEVNRSTMVDLILPVPSRSYDVARNCFPAIVKFFVALIGWQNDCHPTAVAIFA
eukprot:13364211-Heterocapsa_arctica.AAC.1